MRLETYWNAYWKTVRRFGDACEEGNYERIIHYEYRLIKLRQILTPEIRRLDTLDAPAGKRVDEADDDD